MITLNPFLQPEQPTDPVGPESALANYSSQLYLDGETERALEAAQQAILIARTVQTLLNMSIILECLGQFDESMPYAIEAFRLSPGDKRCAGHLGRAFLRQGDFPNGWPLYLQDCNLRPQLKDFIPEWTDQDLKDKRVLVIEGEGYGDNLYFMRWLGTLRRLGAKIDYVCQPSLAPLVEHCGYRAIENWSGNVDIKWHEYDYHTSILTLPHKLEVTVENYVYEPYIRVGEPIDHEPDVLRVGICSLAGEGMSMLKQRSMHASQLQQMLNSLHPRHKWVNLHHRYILPDSVDHPCVETWLDTAKAIATCDMVVTVDTGVAHLSGAMGVPTWVLLPGASAWQYLAHRADHPLYPTMRMFRNYGRGLENALEACCDHLSRL